MYQPLLISSLIEHAARYHGDTAVYSKEVDGSMTQSDWATISDNSKRLANALQTLGLKSSDRSHRDSRLEQPPPLGGLVRHLRQRHDLSYY